jgi:peptidoglycan/LPS O-acetylase OafA/YrhL
MTGKQKFYLLVFLFLVLAILAGIIALGHVEEKTSYGLKDVFEIFGTLAAVLTGSIQHERPSELPAKRETEQ